MKKLSALCLAALLPLMANANIIPTNTSITGAIGGPYTWSYQFQLASDLDVHSGLAPTQTTVPHLNGNTGAFLTIYDFAGYIAGSCSGPSGWTCTAQNVGFTPDDTLPNDDAGLLNVTWVYTSGATLTGDPIGLDLGLFVANSIYNHVDLISYTSRATKNNGASIGTIADNVGTTAGPVALRPSPSRAPWPWPAWVWPWRPLPRKGPEGPPSAAGLSWADQQVALHRRSRFLPDRLAPPASCTAAECSGSRAFCALPWRRAILMGS